jgi:hypothetical protein
MQQFACMFQIRLGVALSLTKGYTAKAVENRAQQNI